MGLSRERVRQIGLVALEKLKHAARKTNLEAMLVEHWSVCHIGLGEMAVYTNDRYICIHIDITYILCI